jgi:outer membrane receptor for ferrienterochelin and colicins
MIRWPKFLLYFTLTVLIGADIRVSWGQMDTQERFDDVVISATMKAVKLSESPVHVDIYSKKFFTQNPSPSLFDALQLASGIRPQVNCNVCATGDIHINGMEGPYTMILIDGMPIVSSLASVYGLMGIPTAIIDRIEIVKGPASTLYGSEAMGGLINVILKKNQKQRYTLEYWINSWGEQQLDFSNQTQLGAHWNLLTGVNGFYFGNLQDHNKDGFTDIPLQQRFSVFQQLQKIRPEGKRLDFAWRGFAEDRWGGQLHWNRNFRGGDSVYGESIQTQRLEFLNTYEPLGKVPLKWQNSAVWHRQQSTYGTLQFNAQELRLFSQLTWQKQIKNLEALLGLAYRYTHYDDNTVLTQQWTKDSVNIPMPMITSLPGLFIQDEIRIKKHQWLLGYRADYHQEHGLIQSFRGAWKWDGMSMGQLRLNAGTGFRTVNIFTEEHAALTGSRRIIIDENLRPEESQNVNISWSKTTVLTHHGFLQFDLHAFRTVFSNRIVPDYQRSFDAIHYANSTEGSWNQGITVNLNWQSDLGISFRGGITFIDAKIKRSQNTEPERPLHTEKGNAHFALTWISPMKKWEVNYNGTVVSPMILPLASDLDPRPSNSPWWSIQNIHLRYHFTPKGSVFLGIQNLWDWTPSRNTFIISRPYDPFDKQVQYDAQGSIISTPDNPHAMGFDASYVYAPNQGRRIMFGISFAW